MSSWRNNFYGSHSKRGTEVAAILYSLVETPKLNGEDPKRYLGTDLAGVQALVDASAHPSEKP